MDFLFGHHKVPPWEVGGAVWVDISWNDPMQDLSFGNQNGPHCHMWCEKLEFINRTKITGHGRAQNILRKGSKKWVFFQTDVNQCLQDYSNLFFCFLLRYFVHLSICFRGVCFLSIHFFLQFFSFFIRQFFYFWLTCCSCFLSCFFFLFLCFCFCRSFYFSFFLIFCLNNIQTMDFRRGLGAKVLGQRSGMQKLSFYNSGN